MVSSGPAHTPRLAGPGGPGGSAEAGAELVDGGLCLAAQLLQGVCIRVGGAMLGLVGQLAGGQAVGELLQLRLCLDLGLLRGAGGVRRCVREDTIAKIY